MGVFGGKGGKPLKGGGKKGGGLGGMFKGSKGGGVFSGGKKRK